MHPDAGEATRIEQCQVPVWRILGRNPGPMTGPGTNSYLIGESRLCLIDPGPKDSVQLQNFLDLIGGRGLDYILATHTHGDHSPGAAALQEATGAELVGLPAPATGHNDTSFQPIRQWRHGDTLDCGEYSIRLVHTPATSPTPSALWCAGSDWCSPAIACSKERLRWSGPRTAI